MCVCVCGHHRQKPFTHTSVSSSEDGLHLSFITAILGSKKLINERKSPAKAGISRTLAAGEQSGNEPRKTIMQSMTCTAFCSAGEPRPQKRHERRTNERERWSGGMREGVGDNKVFTADASAMFPPLTSGLRALSRRRQTAVTAETGSNESNHGNHGNHTHFTRDPAGAARCVCQRGVRPPPWHKHSHRQQMIGRQKACRLSRRSAGHSRPDESCSSSTNNLMRRR